MIFTQHESEMIIGLYLSNFGGLLEEAGGNRIEASFREYGFVRMIRAKKAVHSIAE